MSFIIKVQTPYPNVTILLKTFMYISDGLFYETVSWFFKRSKRVEWLEINRSYKYWQKYLEVRKLQTTINSKVAFFLCDASFSPLKIDSDRS